MFAAKGDDATTKKFVYKLNWRANRAEEEKKLCVYVNMVETAETVAAVVRQS